MLSVPSFSGQLATQWEGLWEGTGLFRSGPHSPRGEPTVCEPVYTQKIQQLDV